MKRWMYLIPLSFCAAILFAQEETRRIWPEQYKKPAATSKTTPVRVTKKASYKVATPAIAVNAIAEETVVGVTLWRLEPAADRKDATTIRVQNEGKWEEWIPVRVEADTRLNKGDRVRLSVEAARTGHLYIINREQYRDGSVGEPYLIFPTKRILDGDNQTKIGKVVELPAQSDHPPYFTLTPGRSDQIAEIISVFITPTPLENLSVAEKPVRIPADQVKQWELAWGKGTGRLELENGSGLAWTNSEKEAGVGARLLTHQDPSPQTVFYNPNTKSGDPILISVDLRYGGDTP